MKPHLRLLAFIVPLALLALVLYAGPFAGGGGPFPIPFPTNWPGSDGQAIVGNGAGATYLKSVSGGSGSGLPGTNTIVAFGGDPATAAQTNWSAEINGGWYETNKTGNLVTVSNGIMTANNGVLVTGGVASGVVVSNTMGANGDFVTVGTNGQVVTSFLHGGFFGSGAGLTNLPVGLTNGQTTQFGVSNNWYQSGTAAAFVTDNQTNVNDLNTNSVVGAYYFYNATNFIFSNSIAYVSITNGHIFITNYTAAGQSVDIDPSLTATVIYGDNNRTNFLVIDKRAVVETNNYGVAELLGDSIKSSNRLNNLTMIITNGGFTALGSSVMGGSMIYSNTFTSSTNTVQEGAATVTLDMAKPAIIITTNATFAIAAGLANVSSAIYMHSVVLVTNNGAANINITANAPWRIGKPQGANQTSTLTVTNAAVATLYVDVWPGLCSNLLFFPSQ